MGTVSTTLPSDGQTIDAADVNTPINAILSEFNGNIDNDNIKSGAAISGSKIADASITAEKLGTPVAFSARASTTSVADTTYVKAVWGTEDYDHGSNFASSTFTAPYDGIYHFDVAAMLENLGTDKYMFLAIYINDSLAYREKQTTGTAASDAACSISRDISLSATDTVDVYIYHNKGSAVSLTDGFNHFTGHLVGRT